MTAVDVLAVMRKVSRSVSNEAYVEFDEAIDAVAELIEAAGDGTPELGDRAVSAGLWFGPHRAERLRAALARVNGGAA